MGIFFTKLGGLLWKRKDKKENLWVSKAFMNCQSQKFAVLSCEENFSSYFSIKLMIFFMFSVDIRSNLSFST